MLQKLQVPAGNTFENSLNWIWKIIYWFFQAKQITNQVYNHLIKLV